MILDATAANRHMWTTKNPENVVFIDREAGLRIKPNVLADFTLLPFRDESFDFAIFDPPHLVNKQGGIRTKWLHSDPFEGRATFFEKGGYPRKTYGSWWGFFSSADEMRHSIMLASSEIHRVLKPHGLLHFKWNNSQEKIMTTILSFQREWVELYRTDRQTGTHVSDSRTFWVLFAKKDAPVEYHGRWIEIDIDEPTEVEVAVDADEQYRKRRTPKSKMKKIEEFFT